MSNKVFPYFVIVILLVGVGLGRFLSFKPSFSISSMINVIGIFYSIIAVILLYEAISESAKYRNLAVNLFAPLMLWVHTLVPLGLAASWVISKGGPSRNVIASFGISLFSYSVLPMGLFDIVVSNPSIKSWQPVDIRFKRFSFFLLVSGLVLQLISACLGV